MSAREYLVSHGNSGAIGRFRTANGETFRRGERVVVYSESGLTLGEVLCPVTPGHARLLADGFVGDLLRRASADDDLTAERLRRRGQELFADARQLFAEQKLPLELLDVEVLLDAARATLYCLRWGACDERPWIAVLSQRHQMQLTVTDLTDPHREAGCGQPGCGSGQGGCSSCSSGGCGTGCGSARQASDVRAYFASLREKMQVGHRTSLL
jgi:cell fate regulator YaaT (PSP1 superfamily)